MKPEKTQREKILDALEVQLNLMNEHNDFEFDYGEAQFVDDGFMDELDLQTIAPGLLVIDGEENLQRHIGAAYEQQLLSVEIVQVVNSPEPRRRVMAKLIQDVVKMFRAFIEVNNGTLIGPSRLQNKMPVSLGNRVWALFTTGEIMYQHSDGDTYVDAPQ